jgi:hypothetical protein
MSVNFIDFIRLDRLFFDLKILHQTHWLLHWVSLSLLFKTKILTIVTSLHFVSQIKCWKFSVENLILENRDTCSISNAFKSGTSNRPKASRSYMREQPVPTLNRCALYNWQNELLKSSILKEIASFMLENSNLFDT